MPTLSMFYGIIIRMYFNDANKHKQPHIHAFYQDSEAILSILDGDVLDGFLPTKKLRLVQAWIEIHSDELTADWDLAVAGELPYKIKPLE